MSKFVELKSITGIRRFVNTDKIVEIIDRDECCRVYFSEDDFIETRKTYDEVVAMIKQELREKLYESPIEIIQTQMQMQLDGEILKAVQGVGIDVNKEELLKALAYDREQYSKGYKDGVKEFAERLKEQKQTFIGDGYAYEFIPSIEIDVLLAEKVGGEIGGVNDEKEKIYI